jgi:sialic acid synthase SpsE
MNNKEQYYKWVEMGLIKHQTPAQRVETLANWLINVLYTPIEQEQLWAPDWMKIDMLGIDSGEPVNWADLKATVSQEGDMFIVMIDEASPDNCQTLCDYITKYLTAWGWDNIQVQTEW